ncbi:MAG: CDP-alcohol phosphatidyltransferase family protein [Candidatus Rokubacteria bacterium]|nr:CDP-alcohol phosphatidyltransferase family protein [Candidatus Rokubacteria bacterium]
MSRHFERRLSLALTRRLVRTAITPNLMTLVSVAVGLASAPFFLSSAPGWQLAGALLFLAHSILDGCDGELARLKFLDSPHGAILDFWGDNLVHVAVFAGMALGWSLDARASWPLVFGAVAVVGTAGAAVAVYRRGAHTLVPVASASPSSRVVEALAHRDFIYLIVLLAAAGKAAWFLVLAAMGTPIFLILVLWSGRRRS